MGILTVLSRNFRKKSRTRKTEDTVPFPLDFRGELQHALELCTACGTCTYVCSPGAIQQQKIQEGIQWIYDAGRCTFCGRCVDYCPTRALSFSNHASVIVSKRSDQVTLHEVKFQHCLRCGKSLIPMPTEAMLNLYHTPEGAAQALEMHQLCDQCRSRQMSERIKSGFTGRK